MLLDMNVKLRRGHFKLASHLSVSHANVGLFGLSGAGKSTLLGLIAGSIQPESGHIQLDGKVLYDSRKAIDVPREQRPIAAVLQKDDSPADETVQQHLNFAHRSGLTRHGLFKADDILGILKLESILDQTLDQLSLAERQRLALARALMTSPKLLLLDDTFASIGPSYRAPLLSILKRLQHESGLSVIYASQSLSDILDLTDQLVVLENGQVRQFGSLRQVAKHHGLLKHLGLRQIDNILPVKLLAHNAESGCSLADSFGLPLSLPFRPSFALGSQTRISIRANDIALSDHYIEGISIQNQLKGRVCTIIPNQQSVIVQIDCGTVLLVEITLGACRHLSLQENSLVYCLIKTQSIVYLEELETLPRQRVIHCGDGYYYLKDGR